MSSKRKDEDPRVIRSRNLLREALLELVPKSGFEDLTIQEITDQATLNRATFYLHYRDKNELLLDTFDHIIAGAIPTPPPDGVAFTDLTQIPIVLVFNHVAEYAGFYREMLGGGGSTALMARVRAYVEFMVMNWISATHADIFGEGQPPDIVVNFLGAAYLGVISWWLENEMPYKPEEMEAQLFTLTQYGLRGVEDAP